MNDNNVPMGQLLPDNMLDDVNGGIGIITYDVDPYVITSNNSTYSSGPTPKYSVGQTVKIYYTLGSAVSSSTTQYGAYCEIISVSESANCGWIYKEFGYTVRIFRASHIERGTICTNVYESCLHSY